MKKQHPNGYQSATEREGPDDPWAGKWIGRS